MKKILIFLAVSFFVYIPIINAQQVSEKSKTAPEAQNPNFSTSQAQNPNIPQLPAGSPATPGMMAAGGIAQNMVPIVTDSVIVLKELVKILETSKLAGENTDLIQRAQNVIKKGEDALSFFTKAVNSPAVQ